MLIDMTSSCAIFCLPKATAPLVTMRHSRPSFCNSATWRPSQTFLEFTFQPGSALPSMSHAIAGGNTSSVGEKETVEKEENGETNGETCSTMEASRPRARPHSSSRVMTAEPSLMTTRRAFFSSDRLAKDAAPSAGVAVPNERSAEFCPIGTR